jgi:hypothetical protein
MHQMLGRIRDLQDTEVWVKASTDCRKKLRTITREDVEARIQQCLNQVWHGGKARAKLHTEYIEKLRFTVGPHLYEHEYTPAPPEIVLIKGYDDAERSYTTSNHEWMSYFLYMAELKSYSIIYTCDEEGEEDADDIKDVKELLKESSQGIAHQEQELFSSLDITQFCDPVSIQMLDWVASGKLFNGHADCFSKWSSTFGTPSLYTFKLMARKARFSNIYLHPEQHNDLRNLKAYERSKHAILCYTAVYQEHCGNRSIMTELAVDLLLESRVRDKDTTSKATLAELKRPHPVICIDIAKRLTQALGCNNVFDNTKAISASDFETTAVAEVLQDAQSHNLQRGRTGPPTLNWINAVLRSTICLEIDTEHSVLTTPKKMVILLQGHTLLQPSWFEEKWGLKPPELDQFQPCVTDSKAKLTAIQGLFKQWQDATSLAFVKQLDEMIKRRGDEGGRTVRDFSFHHVPKFKIDAKTVAARAAACFTNQNKRKAENALLQSEQMARAERNAAFAARFQLLGHDDKAEQEAARQVIDTHLQKRLPEVPKAAVEMRYDLDAVARNAEYAERFKKERDVLRNVVLPEEQQEAARLAIDAHLEQRLPEAPYFEVAVVDPVITAERQAAYSARVQQEHAALMSIILPAEQKIAARRKIDAHHFDAKARFSHPISVD